MSWAAIIAEFFAGLFSGIKAAKTAKAAGELEAGKREVKAVDADLEEIRHELAGVPEASARVCARAYTHTGFVASICAAHPGSCLTYHRLDGEAHVLLALDRDQDLDPGTAPAATSGALTLSTIEDENWLQIIGRRFWPARARCTCSGGTQTCPCGTRTWETSPLRSTARRSTGFSLHTTRSPRVMSPSVLGDPTGTITATASAARTGSPLVAPTPASGGASGGATEAKQDTGNATLVSILGQLDSKTSTQATASAQTTGNNSLSSIDGKVATAAEAGHRERVPCNNRHATDGRDAEDAGYV